MMLLLYDQSRQLTRWYRDTTSGYDEGRQPKLQTSQTHTHTLVFVP